MVRLFDTHQVIETCCLDTFRDFNPEENVSEKIGKMNEIKDGRGFRKFIKEVLHASTGKTSHELLGSVEIHLKVG